MFEIISVYVTLTLVVKTTNGNPSIFRSTAFENPINEKRLDAGKVIETRREASRTKCALACSKNDDCLSFGFVEKLLANCTMKTFFQRSMERTF